MKSGSYLRRLPHYLVVGSFLLTFSLILGRPLSAQIVVEGTLDELSFRFEEEDGGAFAVASFDSSSAVNFQQDFSTQGEVELTFSWSAPEGQFFEIRVPSDPNWVTDSLNLFTEFQFFSRCSNRLFPGKFTSRKR